jgi:hypothetical protein
VAVFASSAAMVSMAHAGEAGICAKTAKVGKVYSGRYLNQECTAAATQAEHEDGGKRNKYEWTSAAGSKYESSSRTAVLSSEGEGVPPCEHEEAVPW